MTILACLTGLFATVASFVMDFNLSTKLLSIAVVLVSAFCFFLANNLKKTTFASVILILFITDFMFPLLYFTSDGYHSGMPLWILLGLTASLLLLHGPVCIVMFVLSVVITVGTMFFGYYHPMLFSPMPDEFSALLDIVFALICVTCAIGAIYKFSMLTYEEQQKKILEAVKKADEANLIKSEFLSNVSHDIRTPMNAILGYSEIAKQNCDDRAKLMDCFEKITIASSHLLDLINGILEMSRIEMGASQLLESECSIQQIINDVSEILENEIVEKRICLEFDYEELTEDKIICDKVKFAQILQNVLMNAVQYSDEGSKIFVSVKQPEVDNEGGIAKTEIRIRDEGSGIDKSFLDRIFEPFERERSIGKTEISGIGLGLSITRKLVQMMNGKISITSEVGKGTEVFISIPFVIQTLTEIAEEVPEEEIRISGKRILVAEDNSLNREIVKDMLESAGCLVEEAKDGTFAVDMVNLNGEGYYDLILMDIQMPMMDGYEATRIIRSFPNENLSKIPIVALSANAFPDDKKKSFDCGMDAFIAKPVSQDKLARVLNVILNDDGRKQGSDD